MAFLTPDKIITTPNGLTIKQKIIPDSLVATKDVASHVKKGQKMKPCKKLSDGTGKPKGITVHNTGDIKVASGTTAAEQYTRATFNGNMSGVVVHYYVWKTDIWQNLREDERGWHAADGTSRRKSQRLDGSKIGGNLDTIAIECVGNNAQSEETTAKLVAHLCYKHGLNPATDVYTHKYFYPSKNCPVYILPHWSTFLNNVKKFYNELKKEEKPAATQPATPATKPSAPKQLKYKTGDIVEFKGTKHYTSSGAASGASCKPGKAKITNVDEKAKHPYHLVNIAGGGSTVYGWVDEADITGKTTATTPTKKEPTKGDIVNFKGTKQYLSSTSGLAVKCKPGKAKITNIKKGSKHPYHLIRVSGGGSTVYGWVNAADIE
jgi:N-acetylmuramoyl-L-alanine amidase CwlA